MTSKHPNEQEMVRRYSQGESATRIAQSMDLFTTSVTRVLKRNGIKIGYKRGANHPMWKGGRLKKSGYIKIWMPEHPRANSTGYVSEHMIVMEKELKRRIKREEHIHHIDFQRDNNNPENLWVCSDSNHKHAERSIQKLIKELLSRKIILFNKKRGVYEIWETL